MGENGSGKTTLINLISGFLRTDAGSVLMGTEQATGLRPAEVARLGCCRTFQVPQLVGELSVLQNVEAGLLHRLCASPIRALFVPWSSHRIDRRRRREALAVCEEMGFTPVEIEARAEILPLGLRRLAEVARAAATGAEVVFLDEPAAGLNEEELVNLSQSIRAFARAGRTILVVEHNAQFVLDTCDDVLLMRAGEVENFTRDVDPQALPEVLQRHLRRAAVGVAP
jgi:branched-chain amino acid transport system permease protein